MQCTNLPLLAKRAGIFSDNVCPTLRRRLFCHSALIWLPKSRRHEHVVFILVQQVIRSDSQLTIHVVQVQLFAHYIWTREMELGETTRYQYGHSSILSALFFFTQIKIIKKKNYFSVFLFFRSKCNHSLFLIQKGPHDVELFCLDQMVL